MLVNDTWRSRMIKWLYKYRYLHLMAIPGLLYFIVFKYLPMYGIIMAFKNFKGTGGFAGIWNSDWVGLLHFRNFFGGLFFWRLLRNTLILSGLRLSIGFVAPIILALLINEVRRTFTKRFIQTVTYMPHFISWVVVAGIIVTLCSPSEGPINYVLKTIGLQPIFFVSNPRYFRSLLVISDIWKNVGWGTIIYLAAITGIDPGYYEAATIDGATKWNKIWHITLPSIREIIAILFILAVGSVLEQNFDQIFNLYSPAVYEVADVFDTYVYRSGIAGTQYSFTTAVGLFKSTVALLLIAISNFTAKRLGSEGLW